MPASSTMTDQAPRQERMVREMEVAREMQRSFLPGEVVQPKGATLAATMRPAHEVGGDFYDVIPLSGGRVGILVADVCGKGVPSALYMALARTLLRAYSLSARPQWLTDALESSRVRKLMRGGSLGALAALGAVRLTNEYLVEHHSGSSMFFTLFYGVYDPRTLLLTYVNAGHNPPLLQSELGNQEWLEPTDMVVGLMPDRRYEATERQLAAGDILIVYSDGVTEAFDRTRTQYGAGRLAALARARARASPQALVDGVMASVDEFAGDASQSDDITLVVLRCGPDRRRATA